jgi:hypothetical protein
MAMTLEPTLYPQQYCMAAYRVAEGDLDREKSGLITSQNGAGNVLWRHRY